MKALAPAFIRWPGGNVAQDYHWQWGIGPRDERPTWINLSWKNEPEPSDFGTDEFIPFARHVGAEPSITVNVEGRGATAEEAAAWVEYLQRAGDLEVRRDARAATAIPSRIASSTGRSATRSGATGCAATRTPPPMRATSRATSPRCARSIPRSR